MDCSDSQTELPEQLSHLRPIALCNVVIKIITKLIANRVKMLMNKLTQPNQSSFIPGRQTTDNIVTAQEIIHSMKRHSGKRGWLAIKVDLEKAYDRISWDFLTDVLKPSAFLRNWLS